MFAVSAPENMFLPMDSMNCVISDDVQVLLKLRMVSTQYNINLSKYYTSYRMLENIVGHGFICPTDFPRNISTYLCVTLHSANYLTKIHGSDYFKTHRRLILNVLKFLKIGFGGGILIKNMRGNEMRFSADDMDLFYDYRCTDGWMLCNCCTVDVRSCDHAFSNLAIISQNALLHTPSNIISPMFMKIVAGGTFRDLDTIFNKAVAFDFVQKLLPVWGDDHDFVLNYVVFYVNLGRKRHICEEILKRDFVAPYHFILSVKNYDDLLTKFLYKIYSVKKSKVLGQLTVICHESNNSDIVSKIKAIVAGMRYDMNRLIPCEK